MPSHPVKLSEDVIAELERVKKTLKLRSLGDAAKLLFSSSTSPLSMFAFLLEMRKDMQTLIVELRKLNKNLEKFLKAWEV